MKVLIIGLGSMGKRRTALIRKHYPDIDIVGVDYDANRRKNAAEQFQLAVYEDHIQAVRREKPDAVLVCSPPGTHDGIILDCIHNNIHVFSEINLFADRYKEISKTAKERNLILFLSSTQLYRKEVEIITELVQKQVEVIEGTPAIIKTEKINYRYHVGQYLPDWHPWDSRNNFFPWNKRTNGCREIFAIELPWLLHTFGKIEKLSVFKGSISSMEIEFPDHYYIVMEHENGNRGVFMVDVVCRCAVRELLVYSESLHLTWNGSPDGLFCYSFESKRMEQVKTYSDIDKNEQYAASIIENAYLDELAFFIDSVRSGKLRSRYSFEEDLYTLQVIDTIESL